VRRVVYLVVVALVAMMILVPAAGAQETMPQQEETIIYEKEKDLPKSGGPGIQSVLLPAAALLVGSGVLAYAVLRRR
jgi:hypothetical protein